MSGAVKKINPMPEFKTEYLMAFLALLLYKNGGSESITVDLLERFPEKGWPKVTWDGKHKRYILKLPKEQGKRIITELSSLN